MRQESKTAYRHWSVSVKAPQKNGVKESLDRSGDNCASRHAFARGSPARQRRMNSDINWLVALSSERHAAVSFMRLLRGASVR